MAHSLLFAANQHQTYVSNIPMYAICLKTFCKLSILILFCVFRYNKDLPGFVDDPQFRQRIKENVLMIDDFLVREIRSGRLKCGFTSPYSKILIHRHCHLKPLFKTIAMKHILDRMPGVSVSETEAGCCGMAGSCTRKRISRSRLPEAHSRLHCWLRMAARV